MKVTKEDLTESGIPRHLIKSPMASISGIQGIDFFDDHFTLSKIVDRPLRMRAAVASVVCAMEIHGRLDALYVSELRVIEAYVLKMDGDNLEWVKLLESTFLAFYDLDGCHVRRNLPMAVSDLLEERWTRSKDTAVFTELDLEDIEELYGSKTYSIVKGFTSCSA